MAAIFVHIDGGTFHLADEKVGTIRIVRNVIYSGEKDKWKLRVSLLDLLRQFGSHHTRHQVIGNDQIYMVDFQQTDSLFGRRGGQHLIADAFKDQLAQGQRIFSSSTQRITVLRSATPALLSPGLQAQAGITN